MSTVPFTVSTIAAKITVLFFQDGTVQPRLPSGALPPPGQPCLPPHNGGEPEFKPSVCVRPTWLRLKSELVSPSWADSCAKMTRFAGSNVARQVNQLTTRHGDLLTNVGSDWPISFARQFHLRRPLRDVIADVGLLFSIAVEAFRPGCH